MKLQVRENLELPTPLEPTFDFVVSPEAMRLFTGYGPIPGIQEVHFERGGVHVAGSRATVLNTDGSTHTEEILAHQRPVRHVIGMFGFVLPLSALVSRAEEEWLFSASPQGTLVERTFTFTLRSAAAWPVAAPLVHLAFRRAMRRNHAALQAWAATAAE
jgi:hypothetical protein